ncbi:MAG: hypothetical protein AUH76_14840 [Candidatus Rokubacteria bacterium 13_1_40CM_4_67_11]|nr:MAG: hypothetical protein AUH76_14840 [Candidatus Rokubacteria bacterium 13_1_40CM_4_67_11]
MTRRLASLAAVAVALTLISAAPALATTVVPVSDTDLAAQATAIVLGRVTTIQSHLDSGRGQIFTDITLAVDEVLAGPALPVSVTIRQPGGRAGGYEMWIEGSPEFIIGERVLVFLRVARDGTLRVLHLYQGKFSVMVDPLTGRDVAIRITGAGVRVLPPLRPGAAPPPKDTHELDDLRRTIRALRGPAPPPAQAAPLETAPTIGSAVVEQHDAFVFNGTTPARWFEPDSGQPVTMFLNSSGEPAAATQGFDQVRQAMAAWSNDPQSNFRYADGGFTSAAGFRFDGVNAVSWNDPDDVMAPPSNCSGVLGMGGFFRSTTESRDVNGTTFYRILEGDVVINNGWEGCGFYESFLNFAEVLTHELGHVLGLGHTSDTTATMYAAAHFDGRGASIKADDIAGLRYIYPIPALTLAFASPTSGATVSGPVTVSLTGSGGTGPYSFNVRLDGTTIGSSASFPWNTTATADGAHTLSATLTDSAGRTASASISVTVANSSPPPPPPGGTLLVAITQPSNGATVSGVPWAVMWVDGQSGSSNTFTLTLAGQTMGTTTTASRGPISMPYDTRTVANGSQPLTATVRDATGNTGSATITVNVNNAGAPPSITASFTNPPAGAMVSGMVTVGMAVSGSTAASRTFQLSVDGTVVSTQTVAGTTASYAWNTTSVGNGSRTLSLSVTDSNGGSSATVTRTVSVQNAGPLTASITTPANGATVAGTVTITVAASGGTTPFTYAFSIDGTQATVGTSSSYAWNSTSVADGAHTLGVIVTDNAGGSVTRSVNVTVSNASPPPPPPPTGTLKVYITSPSSGAAVSGTNWVTLWLSGASGSSNTYTLSVGGQTVATSTTSSTGPVSMPWSTFAAADGPQTLTASARDATGNTGAASIPITVANNGAPPPPPPPLGASFTSPASGATVSGMVTVGMSASGGTAPYTYTLTIDGGQAASGASASYSWSTTDVADGAHTLGLTVTDAAGRTASAARTVTVANAGPPPPGGTLKVYITSPTSGATVSGTVWVNIWIEGAVSGNRVFTLRAGGTTVISTTDSGVHVTLPWNTPGTPNGATTLTATVQDASGNSGSAAIPVTVGN